MSNLDVDTRADIYSLGVLLYELLTGSVPFDGRRLASAGMAEMQRVIREEEPPKPSTRLGTLSTEIQTTVARQRQCSVNQLGQSLSGDLDWIIMKCLDKSRTRRYEPASNLAADVQRYLEDEPIEARPPSQFYLLRKFASRNQTGVILAAFLVLLVATSIGIYIEGTRTKQRQIEAALVQVKAERQEADRQRDNAKQQQQIASAVNDFLTNMLVSADPWGYFGDKVTVLQAIDAAKKEVDKGSLKTQPLVEASIREVIGRVLRSTGHYEDAEASLRKALSIYQRILPANDPRIDDCLQDMAILCDWNKRYGEGEALARQALAIRQKVLPPGSPEIADSLMVQSYFFANSLEYKEAETAARQAIEIYRKAYPPGDPYLGTGMVGLAEDLAAQGDTNHAELLARGTIEAFTKAALPTENLNIPFIFG